MKKFIWCFISLVILAANVLALALTKTWTLTNGVALLLGNLLLLAMLFYLLFLVRFAQKLKQQNEQETNRNEHRTFLILCVMSFILPFVFMIHVPASPDHSWDFFTIFASTSAVAGHSFGSPPNHLTHLTYYLRYANNQFLGVLVNHLFSPFASQTSLKIVAYTVLPAFCTALGLAASSRAVKRLAGSGLAALYNLMLLAFIPFYYYGAQLYSDTLSLPFVALGLLFLIKAIQENTLKKQGLAFFAASLALVLGYELKPTVIFLAFAALLFLGLNKKWKSLLLFLALFTLCFAGGHEGVQSTIKSDPAFTQKAHERYDFPLIHWIAMSWSPESRNGGFNLAVRRYTQSFPNYQAKQKADTALLLTNLKRMGFPGVFRQILRKLSYTWLFPGLNSSYYTYRHANPVIARYFDYLPGKKQSGVITGWLLLNIAEGLYWFSIVFLMVKEGLRLLFHRKNWQDPWSLVACSILGLALFLILWEANSRYLYHYAPLIIALATLGFWRLLPPQASKENDKLSLKIL